MRLFRLLFFIISDLNVHEILAFNRRFVIINGLNIRPAVEAVFLVISHNREAAYITEFGIVSCHTKSLPFFEF